MKKGAGRVWGPTSVVRWGVEAGGMMQLGGHRTQPDPLRTWGVSLAVLLPHLLSLAQPVRCGVGLGLGPFPQGWGRSKNAQAYIYFMASVGFAPKGSFPRDEGKVSADEHGAKRGFSEVWLFYELLLLSACPVSSPHTASAKASSHPPEVAAHLMSSSLSDPGPPGLSSGTAPIPQCHHPDY